MFEVRTVERLVKFPRLASCQLFLVLSLMFHSTGEVSNPKCPHFDKQHHDKVFDSSE